MRRRIFTILSALSLLLCIGTATIWVRSGFTMDTLGKEYGAGRSAKWVSAIGALRMVLESQSPPRFGSRQGQWAWQVVYLKNLGQDGPRWKWRQPYYHRGIMTRPGGRLILDELCLPYWLLTLSTAMLFGLWWRRYRKARCQQKAGLCRICGYDLRASPDRCPECGTPIAPPLDSRQSGTA